MDKKKMVRKRKTSEAGKRIQELETRHRELELDLKVRLDRLEQSESNRIWHIRTLWLGVIGLLIHLFAQFLAK